MLKIFLIGMMGSGKSYWKQELAKLCKTGGYDLDFIIEAEEEKTIAEIFEENGEPYFRKSEAKLLRWFGEKKAFVLATGGGTPCFHDNMNWMNQQGTTIWIDEPLDTLVSRLLPEKSHRPLIAHLNDMQLYHFLENKLAERRAFYSQSTHHLQGNTIQLKAFKKIINSYA
ncbi:MAG: shikimate kinase [Sediminibacterium sp.]|nr:shikimate kinase [Sediminibacterium sp.]